MLRFRTASLLAPLMLAITGGCATLPMNEGGGRDAAVQPAPQQGMVSAADPRAAQAGAEILRQGGNATDAAIAVLLALNVVEPQSSGIGGGGFLVLRDDGALTTYDGRETAPAAATGDWFMRDGRPIPFAEARPGGLSTGVPGNVAMMALAHAEHGRLPWRALFGPAIRLARDGFTVTQRLHDTLASAPDIAGLSPEGGALFFGPDGAPVPVGTTLRNPEFARFLTRVADEGAAAFYTGDNARAIVEAVRTAPRNPAPMTLADMAGYRAVQRPAVCGDYRAYAICGMGPPSSGATTVYAIVKQLEDFDMASLGAEDPQSWHLIADSMRLAYADRGAYLADGDVVSVPVRGLMDADYLAGRGAMLSATAALDRAEPGTPPGSVAIRPAGVHATEHGTSHFVVVDGEGDVASLTSTVESAFGSGLFVNGYFLNNELTDFSFVPVENGMPVANAVGPGKRPRSSLSPSIVMDPNGDFRLAIGAAGGSTIIAQTAKTIIAVIDWNMDVADAIALPVIYAPGDTVLVEEGTALVDMAEALTAMGHDVRVWQGRFKANGIERADGILRGGADPRSEGAVVAE
ncbi:gamma-glutamyltransferase [Croceicoccus sp. YJ47]|uniref:gamma-glutamyltransferase n=1 Tax=Croceicoccus sp. YJ47 TaxID=2798724 RepID=UPI00192471D0|nr:gamma-glutamyltransferase [Croceicoccus sp. YJ47]QQN74675.1 gamma-glutamyltransferase [Croceicoccus sp. YJ47]